MANISYYYLVTYTKRQFLQTGDRALSSSNEIISQNQIRRLAFQAVINVCARIEGSENE